MNRWLQYFKERFPLPTYFLLVSGIVSSGWGVSRAQFQLRAWLTAFIGTLLFFFLLRLMDEVKDLKKDLVAHPERPLPRGLLSFKEAMLGIYFGTGVMGGFSLVLLFSRYSAAGAFFAGITLYLYLMFKEFFCDRWLNERPLIYASSHQAIMLPIVAFAAAVYPGSVLSWKVAYLGIMLLGAFFTYEICRKLDPAAHPVLRTYLQVYGRYQAIGIVFGTTLIAAVGAYLMNLHFFLWPLEAMVLLSMARLKWYKVTETLATLSLIAHIWALPVNILVFS